MNRLLLLTFLDVLETRNFNRTAERLNITQSTVSARIRQLEDDLGTRLFERGRGGAQPTAAGRRFEPHCQSFLAAWTLARRDISAGEGPKRPRLRVAVQFSLAKPVLVEWARQMRLDQPRLAFYLESNFSQQIQRDILSGDTDIGIIFAAQNNPDLHISEIGQETYVMLSTDCDDYDAVDWQRYIKVAYTSYFDRQHDMLFVDVPPIATSVGSEDLAANFLRKAGGTAYMPSLLVPNLLGSIPGLKKVANAPEIPQPVFSVVHIRKRRDSLTHKALSRFEGILNG